MFAKSPKRKSYNISDARTHTDHNITCISKEEERTDKKYFNIFFFFMTMVDLHFDKLNFFSQGRFKQLGFRLASISQIERLCKYACRVYTGMRLSED